MKKMSRGEQIKNLKSKKSALLKQRDLSMKNRRMSAQQAAQQVAQEQAQKRPTRISIYDRYVR